MATIVPLDAPVVVGSGVAGLSVALGLGHAYVVTTKEMGSSWWAQGGIAAALASDDSPQAHAADTMAMAGGLAVDEAVAALTMGGPEAVARLIALGVDLDRDDDGVLLLGTEDGHGAHRVVHADGDATGAEVMRSLNEAVADVEDIQVLDGRVVDLARNPDRVVGVVTAQGKQRVIYTAPAVVLATGGAARIYARTTNPPGMTGEGVMIASRAGARLADLEFFQFHPTALDAGKDPMPLLPDVLRAEGARLVDASGRRFMDQHPLAEQAPRDVVSHAIFLQHDRGGSAYLDARAVLNFHERFPTVTAHAMSVGLDPTENLLPVSPAAHYYMGGIDADTMGRTSVAGLWAVGECASTGVHGANRLPYNSLLEGLVFGARVAHDVASQPWGEEHGKVEVPPEALDMPVVAGPVVEELRQVMWDRAGLIRTGDGLWQARSSLVEMEPVLGRTIAGRNAADLALLVVMAALRRSESRGGHFRADYPDQDPKQAMRALVVPGAVPTVGVG